MKRIQLSEAPNGSFVRLSRAGKRYKVQYREPGVLISPNGTVTQETHVHLRTNATRQILADYTFVFIE